MPTDDMCIFFHSDDPLGDPTRRDDPSSSPSSAEATRRADHHHRHRRTLNACVADVASAEERSLGQINACVVNGPSRPKTLS